MALYPYQERVDRLLQAGKSVILQAPTGAGKTRAALFPFLDSWREPDAARFPRQCIYAVPMRVLANQFEEEYHQVVATYTKRFGLMQKVKIQTGTRAEDRRLEADLIFTTIDQALSSFLTIPYSLGNRQANLALPHLDIGGESPEAITSLPGTDERTEKAWSEPSAFQPTSAGGA